MMTKILQISTGEFVVFESHTGCSTTWFENSQYSILYTPQEFIDHVIKLYTGNSVIQEDFMVVEI